MPKTGARHDPFPAFRFEVKLDDLPVAGFSEVSGLQVETEVQDYPEGGLNTHVLKFPGRIKQTNLTLKRGIVDRAIWNWFQDLIRGDVRLRGGSIVVRDPSGGQVLMEWEFQRAFPAKWVGPELSASQNNIAVETLELAHRGIERRV